MKTCLFILLSVCCCVMSCQVKPVVTSTVIATTSWTAAYAMAAGATDVTVLAPYEMVHPSEYELRPGDIERIIKSTMVLYAGYEVMVRELKTGLDIPDEKMVRITTSYNFAGMEESVMRIAKRLGTEKEAHRNLEEIRKLLEAGRNQVHTLGLDQKPAVVHFFQESLVRELGITPVLVFGPAPPEPKQLLEMSKTNAALIIDNAHNPVGGSLRDVLKEGRYKSLLNFPGLHQTKTIADVIRYNIDQLVSENPE